MNIASKTFSVAALLVGSLALTGCYGTIAFAPNGAPIGAIYSAVQTGGEATANPVGAKHGEACAMTVLGLVTLGDATIATAAKAGGITKIGVVDHDSFNVLGVYAKHCVEVSGD